MNYWWELRSEISSPFERPLVNDWGKLKAALQKLPEASEANFWKKITHNFENLHSLYEIAGQIQLSTLQLAIALRPLIKTGDVTTLPYQEIVTDERPVVVLVDDHVDRQRLVESTLNHMGYRVQTVADPFKALVTLQQQNPELIIINAEVEKMNGFQLASLYRTSPVLRETPMVLLVEQASLINDIKVRLAGANAQIAKPVLPQDLQKAVQKFLGKSSQNQSYPLEMPKSLMAMPISELKAA